MTTDETSHEAPPAVPETPEKQDADVPLAGSLWLRGVLFAAGSLCLVLGLLGMFLPLLPTTPLLLVAAACYARASRKVYSWLLSTRICGPIIREWRETRSVPARPKWTAVILVFVAFSLSVLLVPNCVYGYVTLFVLGSGLIVFLAALPTRPRTVEADGV